MVGEHGIAGRHPLALLASLVGQYQGIILQTLHGNFFYDHAPRRPFYLFGAHLHDWR